MIMILILRICSREEERDHEQEQKKQELFSAHFVIEPAREQPPDPKHIGSGAQGAVTQAVFALAKLAGAMVDRNFDEAIAGAFDQGRDKAMHPLEGKQRADALAPHCLQGAAGVAHPVFSETASNEIGDAASDALH